MQYRFADRLSRVPASFLDELFRVSAAPSIISFAGGLPSSALIDTGGIAAATRDVMEGEASVALQYTTTDGYLPLREFIAERYRRRLGIPATAGEIQIVNGSQQCLDLFAKIFLDKGDHVGMERPGYLGAIEAFSLSNQPSTRSGWKMTGLTLGHSNGSSAVLRSGSSTASPTARTRPAPPGRL